MAARFCCTVPSRSNSPEAVAPRPLKQWRSLAAIRHPHQDSRRLLDRDHLPRGSTPDTLELQRIFVTASLPDDHPDALHIADRKPSLDDSIICSPSFTNKVRRQLSRKSLAPGKGGLRLPKRLTRSQSQHLDSERQSSNHPIADLFSDERNASLAFDSDALSITLDEAEFAELRLDGANDALLAPRCLLRVQAAKELDQKDALAHARSIRRSHSHRRSASLPRALLAIDNPAPLRRAHSSSDLGDATTSLHDAGHWQLNSDLINFDDPWDMPLQELLSPLSPEPRILSTVPEQLSPSSEPDFDQNQPRPQEHCNTDELGLHFDTTAGILEENLSQPQRPDSELSQESCHLYNMRISQHLRSQSQQTVASTLHDPEKPWNQHRPGLTSLDSMIWSASGSPTRGNVSNISLPNARPSLAVARRMDASSSVYSRSPSSESLSLIMPYDIARASIGLRETCPAISQAQTSSLIEPKILACHAEEAANRASNRDNLESNIETSASHPGPLLTNSSSSASLGRSSKFKEDLVTSIAPKSSKKRRSVLQFFFPKFSKPKLRSISSPALFGRKGLAVAMFDGPSDEPGLLAVPGQSSETNRTTRASSLMETPEGRSGSLLPGSGGSSSVVGPSSQSLAEYELTLSVSGDDRRRKSAVDLDLVQTAQGVNQSVSGSRPLRRAQPLSGTEGSLMEKALHHHHLEKAALFRSHSKRSSREVSAGSIPVFNNSFNNPANSNTGTSPVVMDEVDPLQSRRSHSMQNLGTSRRLSKSALPHSLDSRGGRPQSFQTVKDRQHSTVPLAAWSRFPSHTREQRCGSAGREDNVITRDFVLEQISTTAASDIDTPSSRERTAKMSVQKSRDWVVKSRSMTFGSVVRYYSTMFTSSAARNRRSSIAMGGKLEHPELEILPPIFPAHAYDSPRQVSSTHLGHFVDHIKVELNEEVHHLAAEIREEGQHLKDETHDVLGLRPHLHVRQRTSAGSLGSTRHDPQAHLHKRTSAESLDPLSRRDSGESNVIFLGPQKTRRSTGLTDDDIDPLEGSALDGAVAEQETLPSAQRFSRMYQAYVQIPTSMDANRETDVAEARDENSPDEEIVLHTPYLTVPTNKRPIDASSVIRRYPSVTVVDDRKGHWRSISLISAQSGKSLRNSTNDLLNLIVEAKNVEHDRLMASTEKA